MTPTPAGAALCALYPTSRSLEDLVEPFQSGVVAFVDELEALGCTVHIAATRRPEQRAWLMRGAWDVASWGLAYAPTPRADLPITWTRAGAQQMVRTYELVHRPSLTSRHIDGRAADLTITGPLERAAVEAIGAKHGVHPLDGDPVHWSDDGH